MEDCQLSNKINNKNSIFLGIALCCYVTFVFLKIRLTEQGQIQGVTSYIYCYHLINYQAFGLCPRGLIGTILKPILPLLNERIYTLLFCAIPLVFSYLICFRYSFAVNTDFKKNAFLILLGICILTFPSTYVLFQDIGRYDIFCLFLLLFCTYYFPKYPTTSPGILLFSSILCLFIHEAALFMFIPGIFSLYLSSKNIIRKKDIISIVITCIFLIISLCIINVSKQNFQAISIKDYLYNSDWLNILNDKNSLPNDYTDKTQIETIKYGLRLSLRNLLYLQLIFIFPLMYVLYHLWKLIIQSDFVHTKKILFCAFCCHTPLLMVFLGCDFGRWFSAFSFCNAFSLYSFSMHYKNKIFVNKKLFTKILIISMCYLTLDLPVASITPHHFTNYTRKINIATKRIVKLIISNKSE